MKALSVRQPHAEAIMRGIKKIEYRSMATKHRGRCYIYASASMRDEDDIRMLEYGIKRPSLENLERGILIGSVEIYECEEIGPREYHWLLRKPKRLKRQLKPKNKPQPVFFNPF